MNFSEVFKLSGQLCKFSPDGKYLVSGRGALGGGPGLVPQRGDSGRGLGQYARPMGDLGTAPGQGPAWSQHPGFRLWTAEQSCVDTFEDTGDFSSSSSLLCHQKAKTQLCRLRKGTAGQLGFDTFPRPRRRFYHVPSNWLD